MRRLSRAVVGVVGAGLIATAVPVGASAAEPTDPLFGQHIGGITAGVPDTLPRVGAVRLWDAGVSWRDLEPVNGQFNFAPLQAAVDNARARGATEILYTMGNTPAWAASPTSAKALYGPGSNAHPRSTADYVDFVTQMFAAVKGITAFQVWNEANLPIFYAGTPAQIAELTKAVAPVVRANGAKVVAASTTVRPTGPVGKWGKAYGAAMRKAGAWRSVDVVSGHFYPPSTLGPSERVKYIKKIKSYYKRWGAGRKPLWDTEMSFGDTRRGFGTKYKLYTGDTAATYVARAYLDARRYGVQRVFWYGWNIHILGTDMTDRTNGGLVSGGQAFLTMQDWMGWQRWRGCKVKSSVTSCTVGGSTIRYASGKPRKVTLPSGTWRVDTLTRGSQTLPGGTKLTITSQPVRVTKVA